MEGGVSDGDKKQEYGVCLTLKLNGRDLKNEAMRSSELLFGFYFFNCESVAHRAKRQLLPSALCPQLSAISKAACV